MTSESLETLPLFAEADPSLVAYFTTRTGGASEGCYTSLNLGLSSGDQRERVIENRRRVARFLECELSRWVVLGQVHGADVHAATLADAGLGTLATAGRTADAIFLGEPALFALSLSADCPLVVVIDRRRRLAGVAHAGWRGTAAGVLANLIAAFRRHGAGPESLEAAVSPGICGACYPVGEEVWSALGAMPEVTPELLGGARFGGPGDARLDLRRLQVELLLGAGIEREHITVHADCSACRSDRYFSHRRDRGMTGRAGALVGWR